MAFAFAVSKMSMPGALQKKKPNKTNQKTSKHIIQHTELFIF